ncbi:MAG: CarD family transcriptional regulator [Clostridiales bacterium]|nr:CarD family transcriptional regulator [Clostridiales bacterium]
MFNIGDKIVYPVQGVGIIDVIEDREFHGEVQKFYNIHLINNSMKLMLPSSRINNSNIRLISDSSSLDHIFKCVLDKSSSLEDLESINSKERMAINNDKMKSGTLEDLVEVVFNLSHIKKKRTLNSSETQQLKNARKFVIDEISLAKEVTKEEASDFLDKSIHLA